MKKEIKSFSIKCCFLIFAISLLSQSCVSLVKHEKMQLKTKKDTPVILKLHNYGEKNNTLLMQSENLIKGRLCKNEGEEYGYYVLSYKTEQVKLPLGLITGMFFYLVPLGLPTGYVHIFLQAKLYIFDSQGFLVKEYSGRDFCYQKEGIYYGHNPTKKVAKKYSRLYEDFFEMASLQGDKINKRLLKKGPITKENKELAKTNIEAFFKEREENYAKAFEYRKQSPVDIDGGVQDFRGKAPLEVFSMMSKSSPYATYYAAPQIEERIYRERTSNFDFNKLNGGLEGGTYYCTINNLRMTISLMLVSLSDGDKTIMGGTCKVSGNKLIVNFYDGRSITYTIEDSKNFYIEGTNEYWVHESIH